jgi:hypothetical protein
MLHSNYRALPQALLSAAVLTVALVAPKTLHAQTWQCTTLSGHTYQAGQNVPSDSCKLISYSSPYSPDPDTARPSKAAKPGKKLTKKPGVTIGMSEDDVISQSSWGRPEHINRTTTRHGVREQWVYGGRNYLYFEDGILTAIQN